jgi:hypothetical protein
MTRKVARCMTAFLHYDPGFPTPAGGRGDKQDGGILKNAHIGRMPVRQVFCFVNNDISICQAPLPPPPPRGVWWVEHCNATQVPPLPLASKGADCGGLYRHHDSVGSPTIIIIASTEISETLLCI